jgi:hypothetical protein
VRPFDSKTYLVEILGPYLGSSELPGLFERYCLEATDDDDGAIGIRLADVKALWDKRLEHPKYGPIVRTLADAHLEAELTLCDPRERRGLVAEAAAREREKAAASEQALVRWRELLTGMVAAGGLNPTRRTQLERMAETLGLDRALVARELAAAPQAAMPDVLKPELRQRIREALQNLARDVGEPRLGLSLYHALGLEITDDGRVVEGRHAEAMADNHRRAIGTTATLWKNVLSLVKEHLIVGDPRAYVAGLVSDVQAEMEYDGLSAATDGVIDVAEAEQMVRKAMALGLTRELADRVVVQLAQANDASVRTGELVDYVACPACNTPHSRSTAPQACQRCGAALFVTCPVDGCGTRNDATASRCSKCGSDLHRFAEASRRLAGLDDLLAKRRVAHAADELAEIERVLGAQSVPGDLRERVTTALGEAERLWEVAERAIAARNLYGARRDLRRLQETANDVAGPTGDRPKARLTAIDVRLAGAEVALARARSATGQAREAALVEALEVAADSEEAQAALATIPPAPVTRVDVALVPAGVAVRWDASPTTGVRYVVRRIDARTGAAERIAERDDTDLDDVGVDAGIVARYDVVVQRGTARSTATTSAEILVAREVEGLTVADADGEVRLTWRGVPAGARVLVRRREDGGGAETQLLADRSGLVDRTVRNGQRYAYHVSVEYTTDGGGRVSTSGVVVFGQPAAPPEGIEELRVAPAPGGVLITFAPPASGSVTILRCAAEPRVALGDLLDPSRLDQLGTPLPGEGQGARDGATNGICWYLPVTVAGGTAIAGRPLRHLALGEIANVTAVELPGQVRVTWEWPPEVRLAKVVWRRDQQPGGPDDPDAESAWVRLGEYRDGGGFTIATPGPDALFVAVVSGLRVDGELLAGTVITRGSRAAIRPSAKVDLRYRVKCSGLRRKRLEVEVLSPEGVTAPELVLVARSGDLLPRTAADGEVLARLGGGEALVSSVDLGGRKRPLAVRMFLGSTSSANAFQLFDPAADELLIT